MAHEFTSSYVLPVDDAPTKEDPTVNATSNVLRCRKKSFVATRATKFEAACVSMLERKSSNSTNNWFTLFAEDSVAPTPPRNNNHKQRAAVHDVKELGQQFACEDRKPVFCWATFLEEVVCQTTFSLFGPVAILWIVPICGVYGSRITGFFPGGVPLPEDEKKRRTKALERYGSAYKPPDQVHVATQMFVFQIVFWAVCYVPVLVWLYRYWTGDLVPVSAGEASNATAYTTDATATQVYPVAEIYLPTGIYLLRQLVISIKYAFRARRTMRKDRTSGRDMSEWGDDMLGSFLLKKPSPEALIRELDRSAWRAGVHLHMLSLEMEGELTDSMQHAMDVPEKTLKQTKHDQEGGAVGSGGLQEDSTPNDDRGSFLHDGSGSPRQFLNLRDATKYVASLASNVATPSFVNVATLIGMCIPFLYRLAHGDAAFGDSHFDRWVSTTNILRLADGVATMCQFSVAASVLFDRQRMALDSWFELLIPSSIPDARDVPHQATAHRKLNVLSTVPDMKTTAQNIFAWNMGRKVLRKIGVVYFRRLCAFLGLFLVLLSFTVVYFVVDILIVVSRKETVKISPGFIMILFFSFMVICVFFKIVFSGMSTNRQMKLHASSITHYRTRLEMLCSCRVQHLRAEHDGTKAYDERIKKVQSRSKEIQRALKLVGDEIESEAENEKIRILGVSVDARMLEALLGLLSALAVTLWQAFMQ